MNNLIEKIERNIIRIPESGCWIWTAYINKRGYGVMRVKNKMKFAHRMSLEAVIGELEEGYFALHKCDVPACVNPYHLYAGTRLDNARDYMERNTSVKNIRIGSNNVSAKLSDDEVIKIRNLKNIEGLSTKELSKTFGVSKSHINRILASKAWKHI